MAGKKSYTQTTEKHPTDKLVVAKKTVPLKLGGGTTINIETGDHAKISEPYFSSQTQQRQVLFAPTGNHSKFAVPVDTVNKIYRRASGEQTNVDLRDERGSKSNVQTGGRRSSEEIASVGKPKKASKSETPQSEQQPMKLAAGDQYDLETMEAIVEQVMQFDEQQLEEFFNSLDDQEIEMFESFVAELQEASQKGTVRQIYSKNISPKDRQAASTRFNIKQAQRLHRMQLKGKDLSRDDKQYLDWFSKNHPKSSEQLQQGAEAADKEFVAQHKGKPIDDPETEKRFSAAVGRVQKDKETRKKIRDAKEQGASAEELRDLFPNHAHLVNQEFTSVERAARSDQPDMAHGRLANLPTQGTAGRGEFAPSGPRSQDLSDYRTGEVVAGAGGETRSGGESGSKGRSASPGLRARVKAAVSGVQVPSTKELKQVISISKRFAKKKQTVKSSYEPTEPSIVESYTDLARNQDAINFADTVRNNLDVFANQAIESIKNGMLGETEVATNDDDIVEALAQCNEQQLDQLLESLSEQQIEYIDSLMEAKYGTKS